MIRLREVRRRFGITAPRVAVKTVLPWYARALLLLALSVICGALALWSYELGRKSATTATESGGAEAQSASSGAGGTPSQDVKELQQMVAEAERRAEIERATYGELTKQVKSLASENAALKEDLAFFQTLMPSGKGGQPLTVNRFSVGKELLPGEYRYRLLLLHAAPFSGEFTGAYQIVADVMHNGKTKEFIHPDPSGGREAKEFKLRFKSYQRIDGILKVPADAEVRRLQVRVYEEGSKSPKLAQTIELSPEGAGNVPKKK